MLYSEMTVGLRVRTIRPTTYVPDVNLEVPEGTEGVVEKIENDQPADLTRLNAIVIRLDQPLLHQDTSESWDPFATLLIFDTDDDDTTWTNARDFEPIPTTTRFTVSRDDYHDAAGTDGGNAFMEMTVSHDGKPCTKVRVDFENDDQGFTLSAKAAVPLHAVFNPPGFDSHMELALNLMLHLIAVFNSAIETDDEMNQISELFELGDLDLDL